MIHWLSLLCGALLGWLIAVVFVVMDDNNHRLIDVLLELDEERRARQAAEQQAAAHKRTIGHLQHELDQRNGWSTAPDDILSPLTPPPLSPMEEYQPHVVEWLPFSLN